MHEDESRSSGALRTLPAAAQEGLRQAFAAEVAERLPRLLAAARTRDPDLLGAVVRDAHSLGSSSAVLGEPAASRAARAAEVLLLAHAAGDSDPAWLDDLAARVEELRTALDGWTA